MSSRLCRAQTEGYLPAASVAFIDEVFKANSAILNTLLTILNERLFDNGADRVRVPLICLARTPQPGNLLFNYASDAGGRYKFWLMVFTMRF